MDMNEIRSKRIEINVDTKNTYEKLIDFYELVLKPITNKTHAFFDCVFENNTNETRAGIACSFSVGINNVNKKQYFGGYCKRVGYEGDLLSYGLDIYPGCKIIIHYIDFDAYE